LRKVTEEGYLELEDPPLCTVLGFGAGAAALMGRFPVYCGLGAGFGSFDRLPAVPGRMYEASREVTGLRMAVLRVWSAAPNLPWQYCFRLAAAL
jgi:hypothetical protein